MWSSKAFRSHLRDHKGRSIRKSTFDPGYPNMSAELQARAKAFLQRTIPAGIDYVPNSIAEELIATYARRGQLPGDAETAELLGLAGMESSALAGQLTDPEAAGYFRESSLILEMMLAERI
jgi:hypothetical protein